MNKKQKILGVLIILVIIGMAVFPPFAFHGRDGVVIPLGHSFAFAAPENGMIDITLLLTQWVGTLIVGGIAFLLLK